MLKKCSSAALSLLWIWCMIPAAMATTSPWGTTQVFVLPEAGRYPFLATIMSAEKTLDLTAFHLTDHEILNALRNAIQRGVRVRVLLETNPAFHAQEDIDREVAQLKEMGAEIFMTSQRFNQSHYNMMVADGKWGLIGTGDLGKANFDGNKDAHPARDFVMPVGEPLLIREMSRVFTADINDQRVVPKETPLVWGPDQTRNIILSLINLAGRSIWVYNQDIEDNGMVRALVGAAKAGVDVRVLVTPDPFHTGKDHNIPKQRRLATAGAKVRLLSEPYIHAKVMIVDGREAYVGSASLNHTSLDNARELGIIASEPKQLAILRKTFEGDWSKAKPFQAPQLAQKENPTSTFHMIE